MPRKRGPARTTTTLRRKFRFRKRYSHHVVPLWFKKLVPLAVPMLEDWLTNQDELEKQLFAELQDDGVDTALWVYYTAFAKRLFSKCLNFTEATFGLEETSLYNEFVLRGLESSVLQNVINVVEYKCKVVRSLLAAPRYSMMFLSVIDNEIDLPAAAADVNLPDVVISSLPADATIDKVLVFLIVRAIENTSDAAANAIQGTQYVRIKKNTGAWGVDDIAAIQLIDNMWTVAADTREFGDVIGGDDARDVKNVVDGNGTYNLRFENADVDLDFLRLNDVQVIVKVWYH